MDIVKELRSDAEDIGLLKTEETDRIRQKYKIYATMVEAADEIERLREALQSIANNSCCGTCQEAALIARKALGEKE